MHQVLRLNAVCGNTRDERRNKQVSTLWKDNQQYGGTTALDGIISKFTDCEFSVNPGETSMQLVEAVNYNMLLRRTTPSEKGVRQRRTGTTSS